MSAQDPGPKGYRLCLCSPLPSGLADMRSREEVREEKREGPMEGREGCCLETSLLPARTWSVGRVSPILFYRSHKHLDC